VDIVKKSRLPLLIRPREAAAELRVSERYVHVLVKLGLLAKVAVGPTARRITSDSVQRVAAQRETDSE